MPRPDPQLIGRLHTPPELLAQLPPPVRPPRATAIWIHEVGPSCRQRLDWLIAAEEGAWSAVHLGRWPERAPWWDVRPRPATPLLGGVVHIGVAWSTPPLPTAAAGVVGRLVAVLMEGYGATEPLPHYLADQTVDCPPWWPSQLLYDVVYAERARIRAPMTARSVRGLGG